MGLIRNQDAASLVREAVVLDLGDLSKQGEALRAKARADATSILEEADAEAARRIELAGERGYDAGYEKGHEAGLQSGTEQGREHAFSEYSEQIERLLAQWNDSLHEFQNKREELLIEARQDVLRFALTLAEMIVYRVIQVDSTVVEDQVGEALRLVSKRTSVRVRVNPDDVDTLRHVLPNLVAAVANCDHAAIVPDESISRGGCILQGDGGEIDASIETQMDRIIEALLPGSSAPGQQKAWSNKNAEPHSSEDSPRETDDGEPANS